jgi:hypothetical protein
MMKPSRFLTEIEHTLTEPMVLDEGLPSLIAGKEPNALPDQFCKSRSI